MTKMESLKVGQGEEIPVEAVIRAKKSDADTVSYPS